MWPSSFLSKPKYRSEDGVPDHTSEETDEERRGSLEAEKTSEGTGDNT